MKIIKRIVSGIASAAICLTTIAASFTMTASAAVGDTYIAAVGSKLTNTGAGDLSYGADAVYPITASKTGESLRVFCVGYMKPIRNHYYIEVAKTASYFSPAQRKAINAVCHYGYATHKNNTYYIATQALIWDIVTPIPANNNLTPRNPNTLEFQGRASNTQYSYRYIATAAYSNASACAAAYDSILANAKAYLTARPTASITKNKTYTLKYNTVDGYKDKYAVKIPLSELKVYSEETVSSFATGCNGKVNCTLSGSNYILWINPEAVKSFGTKTIDYNRVFASNPIYREFHNASGSAQQPFVYAEKRDPMSETVRLNAEPVKTGGFTFRKQWNNIDSTDKTLIKSVVADTEFVLRKGKTYYNFTKQAEGNYVYNGTTTTNLASATKMKTVLTDSGGEGIIWIDGLLAGQYTVDEIPKYPEYNKIHSCRSSEGDSIYHTYFRAGSVDVNIVAGKKPFQDQMTSPLMNWYSFQHADLEVYKQDDKYNGIQGAKFGLYVDYTELRNNNGKGAPQKYDYVIETDGKILTRNGVQWKVGTQVQTATSDIHGKVDFGAVPAYAYIGENVYRFRYIIKELEAPKGYALSADGVDGHSIKMDAKAHSVQGQYTGETYFTNSPQRMEITINKVDDKGKKLQGAVFGLYSNQDGLELRDITKPHLTIGDMKVYHKGDLIAYGTTNSNGELVFGDERGQVLCRKLNEQTGVMRNLLEGKYYVQEITPPKNYVANKQKYEFTFTPNNKTEKKVFEYEATVPNTHKNGEITVIKEGYNNVKLAGAEFKLYSANKTVTVNGKNYAAGQMIASGKTGTDGKLVFNKRVPTGYEYTIEETKAPDGYALSSSSRKTFSLDDTNAQATFIPVSKTFSNTPQQVNVQVVKEGYNNIKLAGAVFGLYANETFKSADGKSYTKGVKIGESVKTNASGEANFYVFDRTKGERTNERIYLPAGHNFYVKEEVTPPNYKLNKAIIPFTTVENRTVSTVTLSQKQIVTNDMQYAKIAAYKQDDTTKIPLDGAVFALVSVDDIYLAPNVKLYSAGQKIAEATTGNTVKGVYTRGLAVFTDKKGNELAVPVGYDYIIKEITPPTGYNSKSEAQQFHITGNPEKEYIEVKRSFLNDMKPLRISAYKKGTDGIKTIPLAGVTFQLKATTKVVRPDGETVFAQAGAVIDEKTTKIVNGEAVVAFKDVPICDKNGKSYEYEIVETKVPNGYILNSTPIKVSGKWNASKDVKSVAVSKTVTNDWDTVRVNVKKVDETTSKPLAGAKYALYANETIKCVDGSTRWEKDKEISVTPETDATGNTTFRDEKGNILKIPVNYKYYIKEVKAPTNFIRNVNWRKEFTAQGNGNGTVAALAIEQRNKPKPLSVTVEKIDKEERTPLEGAEFTLYAPADKDVVNSAGEVLYKKGQRIQIITTTFNGKKATAEFKDVPLGYTYKVVETKAPDNYTNFINEKLERPTWYVEAKDDGKDTEEIKVVIKAENEWQKGIITVRKTDENGDPLAGAVFGLYSVDANGKKGKKIEEKTTKIVKNATTGENEAIAEFSKQKVGQTFIIREEKAPYGYVNLGDKTERKITLGYKAQLYYSSVSTSYTNDWQRGDISVYKYFTKNGTKIPLEGAEFVLYALENVKIGNKTVYTAATHSIDPKTNKVTFTGKIIQRLSTNDKGYLKFDKVPTGYNYMIVETKAPDGYINAHPTQKIELKYNENIEFVEKTASEINKETSLYISKQTLTGSKPLAGATLQLIRVSDNKVIREWKSKADKGEYFEKLLYGKYILREIASPAGFVISTDIPFTINDLGKAIPDDKNIKVSYEGETPIIVMFDETTKVSVSKVDITSGEELIGAKLEVRDDKGNLIESWTSNGKAHLIEGKLIVGHTYTLTETASPAGYVIANKITFTVKGRDKTTGKYVVQKVTMKDDYTHTDISKKDITTGKEIVGATLEIRDSEGRLVERWITDGKPHRIEKLKAGKYTLTETAHPDGYLIADTVTFEVTGERDTNGKAVIKLVVMHDDYTKLSIQKIDKTTKQPLAGARLQLLDKDGNLVYVPDGKGGTIPCEWVSDGTPHMFYRIPAGTYILHEVEAPKGYVRFADKTIVITDEDFMVNGKVDNKIVKTVTVEDDYTKTEIDKTSITDGKKVIGAHLVIKDSKGNKVTEWDTNDKVHRIDRLPVGEYTLTETFAPNGYVIANTIKFTVKETGEIQKVHMIDDITKLEINKYRANAKTNEDKPLAGAVLKLTDKETGKIVDQWTTDGTTHKIYEKLTAGKTYVLEELSAPAGYVVCKDKKEITISTNGKVDTLSLTNDTTKVDILKSTITGDEELAGAHLQVIDTTTNKVVEEWVSEKESHYIEAKLVAGRKYILRETISPNGFTIANDITFVVSTEGKVDKIIMKDEVTKLAISKVSAVTGKELAGATMQVIDKETGRTVDEWVTGEETDGKASMGDMTHRLYRKLVVNRTYILREKIAPENYVLADDIEFTVNADGTVTTETEGVLSKDNTMDKITMTDYQQTGDVVVLKQTEGNKNIANIGFILSGKSNLGVDIYERVLTDENGKATFSNIPVGTYFINEDEDTVPYAYLVAEPQQVEVFYRQTSVNTFNNQERTGTIKIQKKTEGMLNIKGITLILKGISDSGREIEMTSETDENGEALFENLPIGTYAVTEVGETVPEGYLVADELTVTCVYAQTTTKELFNEEKSGSIEIHKTTEGMLNIKDIKFHLTGVSDAGRAINLEAITDEKGIAKFDKVPVGTYMITEDGKTTPIAYMVADKKECKVSYSETTTVEIKNEEKTGSIKVQKKTEGMKDISGIKFHLTGTSDSGRAINLEAVTDKNGVADFGQVPIGTYVISEDGATVPTAYLVADNQECKAIYAQETTVTFVNEKKPTEEQPPQTGYNHPIGIFLPTMLISLAGIAVFSRKRKEEE